jgi:hypothetical protein
MSRRAQKLPDEYQEGTYKRRKSGKVVNLGKSVKSSIRNASGSGSGSQANTPGPAQLPPVSLQHFGEQNDMDPSLDYDMNLDPHLPTQEDVRSSYGKVRLGLI